MPLVSYFSCSWPWLDFYCAKVARPTFLRKYRRGYFQEFLYRPSTISPADKLGFRPKSPENSLRIHSVHADTMHIKIQSRPAITVKQWVTKGKSNMFH